MKSISIQVFIALALVVALQGRAQGPNVVFIMSDDHAANAISAYGGWMKDFLKTPNIDRIAEEGMLLRNVFCNNAICSPSRASIITGQYSHRNGVMDLNGTIAADAPYMMEGFRDGGYQTALIGKWHLESLPRGCDFYEILQGQGSYYDPYFLRGSVAGPQEPIRYTGYTTDVITDRTLDWLDRRDPDKPFLLMMQHKAPHDKWEPAQRHLDLYEDAVLPEPSTLFDDHSHRSPILGSNLRTLLELGLRMGSEDTKGKAWPTGKMDVSGLSDREIVKAAYQKYMKDYARCIAAVDESVGRVLDYLGNAGLEENTVVVYTSDQGMFVGEHGWFDKRMIHEESLRMPFLVRYPKVIRPGQSHDALICNVDFAPTLLDMAGLTAPAAMQGRSFFPFLKNEREVDWRRASFYAYWGNGAPKHYGLRSDRYKLVVYGDGSRDLYDLETDPRELRSFAENPEYVTVLASLEKQLLELMDEVEMPRALLPQGESLDVNALRWLALPENR